MDEASRRAWVRYPQPHARGSGFWVGLLAFLLPGIAIILFLVASRTRFDSDSADTWIAAGVMIPVGALLVRRGIRKGRHAAYLRLRGIPLEARIVDADRTGVEIGDIPVFRLVLEVSGPRGTYTAMVDEVLPPERVSAAIGSLVRVRAHPDQQDDVLIE